MDLAGILLGCLVGLLVMMPAIEAFFADRRDGDD